MVQHDETRRGGDRRRASEIVASTADTSEATPLALKLQAVGWVRRFVLSTAHAHLVAEFAFAVGGAA